MMTARSTAQTATRSVAITLIAVLLATLAPWQARADESPLILEVGHVDAFNVTVDGGRLRLNLKEDVTGHHVPRDPSSVELHVKSAALKDIPAGIPGAPKAYWLPMVQDQGLLWPGWDTLGVLGSGFDESVDLVFRKVEGPGTIGLFGQGTFGGIAPLLEDGRLELVDGAVRRQSFPAHTHAHWTFSKPGVYSITVQAVGTKAGQRLTSEEQTYRFTVGDDHRGKTYAPETEPTDEPTSDPSATPTQAPSSAPSATPTAQPTPEPSPAPTAEPSQAPTAAPTPEPAPRPQPDPATSSPTMPEAPKSALEECTMKTTVRAATDAEVKAAKSGASTTTTSGKAGGSATVPANTHVHPNWVFSALGNYSLTIRQTTTKQSGERLSSTATLRFRVGSEGGGATGGHFDFGSQIRDGKLVAMVKDDRSAPAKWVSPASQTFVLGAAAKATAPAGIEFVAPQGAPVWMIASSQVSGVPWLGANTMHESLLAGSTGNVTFSLVSATGPGKVGVFTSGNFGKVVDKVWFTSSPGAAKAQPAKIVSEKEAQLGQVFVKDGKHFVKEGKWELPSGESCTPRRGMPRTGVDDSGSTGAWALASAFVLTSGALAARRARR